MRGIMACVRTPEPDWQWVVPAGWPSPPQGWAPPPGWRPESDWPTVEAGYRWWDLTESGRRRRGRLKKFLLVLLTCWAAAALSLAAFWWNQAGAWAHFHEQTLGGNIPALFASHARQTALVAALICILPVVTAIAGIRMARLLPQVSRRRRIATSTLRLAGFALAVWLNFNQPWAAPPSTRSHAIAPQHYSDVYTTGLHRDAALLVAITIIATALIWAVQTQSTYEAADAT
jgi:hypothetical protein